jgi:Tfp pilus assembly protein PilV
MAKTLRNRHGASIIEILMTIVVISMTTLIIMAFSRNTLLMNQDSRSKDAATLTAEQKITDLAAMSFSTLPQSGSDVVTEDNISFTRSWTISRSGYIVVAKVTVSWNTPNGNRQVTLAGAVQ